ncbi:hypothetical protein ACP4OV_024083 [Aristida adscensionis]
MAAESISTAAYPCLMRRHETQTVFSLPDQKLHHVGVPPELMSGNAFLTTPQAAGARGRGRPRGELQVRPNRGRSGLRGPRLRPAENDDVVLPRRRPPVVQAHLRHRLLQPPGVVLPRPQEEELLRHGRRRRALLLRVRLQGPQLGTLDFTDGPEPPEFQLGTVAVSGLENDAFYGSGNSLVSVVACLVESCGDLFLAAFAFHGYCLDVPRKVSVFRMDSSAMAWHAVDGLGDDRAFLLGGSNNSFGASCSASRCGLRADCLYWLHCFSADNNILHVYDVKDGTWETVKMFDSALADHKPFWIVPVAN